MGYILGDSTSGILALFIICVFSADALQKETFDGDQVLRAIPESNRQLNFLHYIHRNIYEIDFWTDPASTNHNVDFRVPKLQLKRIKDLLITEGIKHTVLIKDVQRAVDMEMTSINLARAKRSLRSSAQSLESLTEEVLSTFTNHQQINRWLDKMNDYCGSRCQIHNIGVTGEGRTLKVIQIGNHNRSSNRGAIWIEAGIHGREWISPVTSTNIIHKLIRSSDRCDREASNSLVWYILPVANPDGYEYSKVRNRMWRKNRKLSETPKRPWWTVYYYGPNYRYCYGVDLNRNFGFKWGEIGTSLNPCSDIYGGAEAFSESETAAIKRFTTSISSYTQLRAYLSVHSYGQYWLYSWGYTRQLPQDHQSLRDVATASVRSISDASNGRTSYVVGPAARTLYASSGASDDWAKGSLGVKYSYTLELPPSDANAQGNGFLLPTSAIEGVVRDTWPGIRTMASRILENEEEDYSTQCR